MATRGQDRRRGARALGIAFLILGLARVPLPRADYHNVRHHDGPGQTCPMHDHLLHWHPGASRAADVAILHWHWVPPLGDLDDSDASGPSAVLKSVGCDGLATSWDHAPRLLADPSSLSAPVVSSAGFQVADPAFSPIDSVFAPIGLRARAGPRARSFHATFTPDIPFAALFGRWSC